MINLKQGLVKEIVNQRDGLTEVRVELEGDLFFAINYDFFSGNIKKDDRVILNTVAVDLNLGSGGKHFVLWNLRHNSLKTISNGHIMKLCYTPLQISCLSVEEQEGPYHQIIKNEKDLKKMPVIIGELHSQLPAVVSVIKEKNPSLRICYLMTDGAALPIVMSELVYKLKKLGLLDATITVGNAFGGDFEAVNIYSGLVAAKYVVKADIAVVMIGPGIKGTDTALGFTGMEQGVIINAASSLNGFPIAVPRICFKDKRERHYGLSYHTINSLTIGALSKAILVIPEMEEEKMKLIKDKLEQYDIYKKHQVEVVKSDITLLALEKYGLEGITTMGRTVKDVPEFFMAAGAGGVKGVEILK
ncbi:MAG: DUF3866 family protein [Actinobacteria bacterium]|nr:DUF3866 family protein [Actinomycetota bacterium]